MKEIRLNVNNSMHEVKAAGSTPLLYILRNDLKLNGPKFGCGLAQCGACTVLVDDVPTRSCVTPVESVENTQIVTLEGIGTKEKPGRLQKAFIEEQAAQCGYCSNGMIMVATALLKEVPEPNKEEIKEALDGNLCRCGSHLRIIRAIKRAATA